MLVGLAALHRRASGRFAWLLVGASVCFSVTALAESRDPTAYAVGRTSVWLVEPLLAYLLLSFPSGRLIGRAERAVVAALTAMVVVLYLPTLFLTTEFPEPSPWSTCAPSDCPANSLAAVDETPAFVTSAAIPLREFLTALAYFAVAALIARHARRAGPLLRAALGSLLAVAAFRALTLTAYFPARAADDVGTGLDVLGWLWAMALPLLALSFGAGLVNRRLARRRRSNASPSRCAIAPTPRRSATPCRPPSRIRRSGC